MSIVYLNGEYLAASEAKVSVDDRGFLLADGVYEVTPVYRGRMFLFDRHLKRLNRGLEILRIDFDDSRVEAMHDELIARNRLGAAETGLVYMQVTRGVAPRTHAFPDPPVPPTVYAFARSWNRASDERWGRGFRAITQPDLRWHRVDVKTIQLLPNAMAMQAAVEAGAQNAVLVRDGIVTEGAHANLFAVVDGALRTHPADHCILHGITRGYLIELATSLGIAVEERPFTAEELFEADEVFYTGTTLEVLPVVEVDDRVIGDGNVGPVTRRLREAFLARVSAP